MKKTCGFFGIIAFAAVIALFTTGCGSPPPPVTAALPDGVTLDQAIAEAAARIDERIPAGSRIALLNFNSPSDRFSLYVLDELSANLLDSGRLTVVDRREMDLIRDEIDFQFSGDVDDDSIQQAGRRLGAQSIVSGTLTEIGGDYRIAIRVLNVESAAIEVHFRSDIANDRRVQALLEGGRTGVAVVAPQRVPAPQAPVAQAPVAQPLVTQVPAVQPVEVPAPVQVQPAPPPAPPTFRIGDTGPAGGIIFYDRGESAVGWRFLEAASRDVGTDTWGPRNRNVGGTREEIGTGKENTQSIQYHMLQHGSDHPAAMLARRFNQGGFNDWFLPSRRELNLMFWNLRDQNLGDFRSGWYWSSTQQSGGTAPWDHAWAQNFSDGVQSNNGKQNTHAVRLIRRF